MDERCPTCKSYHPAERYCVFPAHWLNGRVHTGMIGECVWCPDLFHTVNKGAAASPASPPTRKIDGKFSTDGVRIFNTVSGEVIPDDEPLFLLRGRDDYALVAIHAYQAATEDVCNELHKAGIQQVREKFCQFAAEHPERMKQPGVTRHLKLEGAPPSVPTYPMPKSESNSTIPNAESEEVAGTREEGAVSQRIRNPQSTSGVTAPALSDTPSVPTARQDAEKIAKQLVNLCEHGKVRISMNRQPCVRLPDAEAVVKGREQVVIALESFAANLRERCAELERERDEAREAAIFSGNSMCEAMVESKKLAEDLDLARRAARHVVKINLHHTQDGKPIGVAVLSDATRWVRLEEYESLRSYCRELRDWKESAIAVTPDMQEIGKLIGLRWGDSVHDKIVPWITQAIGDLDLARRECRAKEDALIKMETALRDLMTATWGNNGNSGERIEAARAALADATPKEKQNEKCTD